MTASFVMRQKFERKSAKVLFKFCLANAFSEWLPLFVVVEGGIQNVRLGFMS